MRLINRHSTEHTHTLSPIIIYPVNQPENLTQSNKWARKMSEYSLFYPKGISHFDCVLFIHRQCCHFHYLLPSERSFRRFYLRSFVFTNSLTTFEMKWIGAQVSCYDNNNNNNTDDDDHDDNDEDMTANCCDNKIENPLYLYGEQGKIV